MIFLLPLHVGREADFDCGLRVEAKIAARCFDIGVAFRDVARLHRQQLLSSLAPEQQLKDRDEVEQLPGIMSPEVVIRWTPLSPLPEGRSCAATVPVTMSSI